MFITQPLDFQSLIWFIINLVLAGCVVWGIKWFLDQLTLPQPLKNIVYVVLGIIGLLWLLKLLGIMG